LETKRSKAAGHWPEAKYDTPVADRKPTDYPIARGVSPPPRPYPRRPVPVARRPDTVVEARLPPIVRPPVLRRRWPIVIVQMAALSILAGICMAAGRWVFHRPENSVAARSAPAVVKTEPVKPAAPIPEPAKPVEQVKPAEKAEPVEKPPLSLAKPIEKAPEPPPAPPPVVRRPAPPTTSLTFRNDIQPLLQAKCVLCHGDRNKFKGGLDARTLRALDIGGDSGPAINRQEPELSPLWEQVANGQMPPGKNKLSESEKKKLHDWLVGGGK
jgi:hypothetical protein